MKIIDFSAIPYNGGDVSFTDRIQGMMQFGFSWGKNMKSQDEFAKAVGKVLDKRYFLLKNVTLQKAQVTIPLILVGPQGIRVIYNSPIAGIFQAKGDRWSILDSRSRKFKPAQPNLLTRTALMGKGVQALIDESSYAIDVESVLALTNPGTHVETQQPVVRVILVDAIERFASRILQEESVLSMEDVHRLVELITAAAKPEEEKQEEAVADSSSEPKPIRQVESQINQAMAPIQSKFNFNRRQWILLGLFVVADILVLIIFVVFILLTA